MLSIIESEQEIKGEEHDCEEHDAVMATAPDAIRARKHSAHESGSILHKRPQVR
jgi:hypothetical protein